MTLPEFSKQMNVLARARVAFLFAVDFEMQRPLLFRLDELERSEILFAINGRSNTTRPSTRMSSLRLAKQAISRELYHDKFSLVHQHLLYGDSYLTNLTIKTAIDIPATLQEIFYASNARYKLCYKNEFLVFSPECFIQITDGTIRSYPMKGTINARVEHAEQVILSDQKELAEHVTIVDLIRNDLSLVARDVAVERFRYVEKITSADGELLQVSSSIKGTVTPHYREHYGDLLLALLPAGSVSGAPKAKTVQIIAAAEGEPRGYYSGVFGIFDGNRLDCGVMIRFIEQWNGRYYYRSGGGITARSDADKEYQEAIDKIYVPIH